jgi:hypothetical protein
MLRWIAGLVVAIALTLASGASAFAWGSCDYTCYGAPYGNTEPPDYYVYNHQVGPTWTGNGWAYLPVGRYRAGRPEAAPPPPQEFDDIDDDTPARPAARRNRPMK